MKAETIVKKINAMFPPTNEDYPVAFIRDGETTPRVSGECTAKAKADGPMAIDMPVVDYYGRNYPWINPDLEKFLESIGMFAEWENPSNVGIHEV